MADGGVGDKEEKQELRAPQPDHVALLVRIRRGEGDALTEFTHLVRPLLLDQARVLGIDRSERATIVTDFIVDFLLKIPHITAPRSLLSFVVRSFRNHISDIRSVESARDRRDEAACELVGDEHVVTATCSAYALRAALGPDAVGPDSADTQTATPAAVLINMLMCGCTQEDRSLLIWSSQRVPMREIAVWLGISYAAARQRITRLRAHLARESVRLLPNLDPEDRVVITRLLRRAGVKIEDGEQTGGVAA